MQPSQDKLDGDHSDGLHDRIQFVFLNEALERAITTWRWGCIIIMIDKRNGRTELIRCHYCLFSD